MTPAPRVLGLRALGLGDFCCAVPAWKALRRAFPHHRLVLAAPAWQRPLLDLCPWIDDLDPVADLDGPAPVTRRADLAVNLHGRGPASTRLLEATAPARLLAFADAPHPHPLRPRWRADQHEVSRWCRLVRHLGIEADETDLALEPPRREPPIPLATVLHPGASTRSRRWPPERWAAVARALATEGHRVAITGADAEQDLVAEISEHAGLGPDADLAGRTDLIDLAALVAGARLVVSGDTGTAHLASAYGTPSVVLFGPTPPAAWGPPPQGPHVALWHGRSGDPHADQVDPGLLLIQVDEVLSAAGDLVGAGASS